MPKRPIDLIVDRNNEAADDGNADHGYIHTELLAYEAVHRAVNARWLDKSSDTHSLLSELQVQLQVSDDQCREIVTKVTRELKAVGDASPRIRDHSSQVHNKFEGRNRHQQKHIFTEHELRDMETSAYEAVDRAFRLQQDARSQQLLSQLRDLFRIGEDHYQIGEANDNEPPSYVSEREPKYRCIIELSYGSFEEWERRKLTLQQQPDERICNRDAEGREYADAVDDDKSDEEWRPDDDV